MEAAVLLPRMSGEEQGYPIELSDTPKRRMSKIGKWKTVETAESKQAAGSSLHTYHHPCLSSLRRRQVPGSIYRISVSGGRGTFREVPVGPAYKFPLLPTAA